jgi:ElaB/YqjD/DUF883 family membrane-anchored ribosome-binding protein
MNVKIPATNSAHGALAEDVRTLLANTAELAGDQISEIRQRLAAALDRGKQALARVRDHAGEGAQATGQAVREHPYQAVVIAFAAGMLIGDLVARRASRNGK